MLFTARRVPKSWVLESSVVVAVLACIFRYITGSRQNRAVVGAVDAGLAPVLQAQFATATAGATLTPDGSAGTTVGAFAWQEVSACEYRLWASGRQHCHGLLVELALPRRQDLVGSLAEALAPSLLPALPGPTRPTGTALGSDVLTIEVPLAPSLVEPFVFAIMQVLYWVLRPGHEPSSGVEIQHPSLCRSRTRRPSWAWRRARPRASSSRRRWTRAARTCDASPPGPPRGRRCSCQTRSRHSRSTATVLKR